MGWPCRTELWGDTLAQARADYAAVANAVAAFEPVTMIANAGAEAAQARAACAAAVEIVELGLDDSWLRDTGPIYTYDDDGERLAVHFGFNAWGEKFSALDRDAAVGGAIARTLGDRGRRRRDGARGRVDPDRRGRHAADDRAVPAEPQPQPVDGSAADRGKLAAALGRRSVRVAGPGAGRGPGHRRSRRSDRGDHEAGPGAAADGRRPTIPTTTTAPRTRDGCAPPGWTSSSCRCCRTPRSRASRSRRSYMNLYICNGAVIVPVADQDSDEVALGDHRRRVPRARGRAGARARDRVRRRRAALHHPAGAGARERA